MHGRERETESDTDQSDHPTTTTMRNGNFIAITLCIVCICVLSPCEKEHEGLLERDLNDWRNGAYKTDEQYRYQ